MEKAARENMAHGAGRGVSGETRERGEVGRPHLDASSEGTKEKRRRSSQKAVHAMHAMVRRGVGPLPETDLAEVGRRGCEEGAGVASPIQGDETAHRRVAAAGKKSRRGLDSSIDTDEREQGRQGGKQTLADSDTQTQKEKEEA